MTGIIPLGPSAGGAIGTLGLLGGTTGTLGVLGGTMGTLGVDGGTIGNSTPLAGTTGVNAGGVIVGIAGVVLDLDVPGGTISGTVGSTTGAAGGSTGVDGSVAGMEGEAGVLGIAGSETGETGLVGGITNPLGPGSCGRDSVIEGTAGVVGFVSAGFDCSCSFFPSATRGWLVSGCGRGARYFTAA